MDFNKIFINRTKNVDVPMFVSSRLLKSNWEVVNVPNHIVLYYHTKDTFHIVDRTEDGFYYKLEIRSNPFGEIKTRLYPTLDFLHRDYPIGTSITN